MTSNAALIAALMGARMLRSDEDVEAFDRALAGLAARPEATDLPGLFRVFTDATEDPGNVMWGLIHLAERYDDEPYAQAFVAALPETIPSASGWMRILAMRQLNNDRARDLLLEAAGLAAPGSRTDLIQLLREITEYPEPAGSRAAELLAALGAA